MNIQLELAILYLELNSSAACWFCRLAKSPCERFTPAAASVRSPCELTGPYELFVPLSPKTEPQRWRDSRSTRSTKKLSVKHPAKIIPEKIAPGITAPTCPARYASSVALRSQIWTISR